MRSAEQNDVTARSQRTHGSQRFRKAHAQIGQVQALRFGETEPQRIVMAWHKEFTRSSEEVRGVRGRIRQLQDHRESISQRNSLICKSGEVAHQL